MSGEGSISNIAEIAGRLGSLEPLEPPRILLPRDPATLPYGEAVAAAFDMRPGELEATRIEPASGILVCGSRCHSGNGAWQVLATVRGADGTLCQVPLTADAARELAAELVDMADVLDGKMW